MRTDVGIMPMDTLSTFALIFWTAWFLIGTLILALSNGLFQHMIDFAERIGETRDDMPTQKRKDQLAALIRVRRSSVAYIALGPIGFLVYIQMYALLRGMYGKDAACVKLQFQKPHSPILDVPDRNASDMQKHDAP